MGGNALKQCKTRRYAADEYFPFEKAVLNQLRADFPDRRIEAIPAYRSKPSFGDMDVLFQSDNFNVQLVDYLTRTFASKQVVQNSNVYSFEHQEFQVDLILTPEKHFQTSLNYFSYNDLGNLLGRISHSMGLKLGHDGLSYSWRDGDYMFATLELERDWRVILPVLGYSYDRWNKGFDSLKDIFEFAVSSPFFNKDIYLLHNRNHTSRVRDAKRKTYMEFLQWLEEAPPGTVPAYPRKDSKALWLPYLFEQLPGFEEKYRETDARFQAAMTAKRRFNGELVQSLTGLSAQALGELMRKIKEHFGGKEALQAFVLQASDAEIEAMVLERHQAI